MSKIYVGQMNLRRWFPPHDRYAACIARLCILRGDFALKMWGAVAMTIRSAADVKSAYTESD
jgi:hypothetical protein